MTADEAIALLDRYLKEACPATYKPGDARLILQAILDEATLKAVDWMTSRIHDAVEQRLKARR